MISLFNKFIFIGEIPLITKNSTFIINGNKRVVSMILKLI